MSDFRITVDCSQTTGEFRPVWRSFGYDEINWTYTPRGKRALREIGQLAAEPYFIRCHHTFTSGNGLSTPTRGSTNVVRAVDGRALQLDFAILDQVIATMLQHNCRPIVELGFMPDLLSAGPRPRPRYDYSGTDLWRYPPRDYALWRELVFQTVQHCVEQWGREEVATWFFEVWNEPDNAGFFAGSVKDYCRMYDYAVDGATAALPELRIGGPALATSTKFLQKFLKHCASGRNAATGGRGTRLDFISCHAKGTEWPLPDQPFRMPSLRKILAHIDDYAGVLAAFPQYQDLPFLLDECDMAVATNFGVYDFPEFVINNSEYYPIFLVRMAKHLCDTVQRHRLNLCLFTTWAFYFEGKRFFEGNRALFTNDDIKKPVFNAFALLEQLGAVRLACRVDGGDSQNGSSPVEAVATRSSEGGVSVLMWNFDEQQDSAEITISLGLDNIEAGALEVTEWILDATHCNSHTAWLDLGAPQDPTPEQVALIKQRGALAPCTPARRLSVEQGQLLVERVLAPQSMRLLTFQPADGRQASGP